jgi:hypothetical protein
MSIMDPALVPPDRGHLDPDDRRLLLRLELLVAQDKFEDAQEVAEDLWIEATDAHKRLYQGLSNALTAVCARRAHQVRGAREIADRTRTMLAPFPRLVVGIELDTLLVSMNEFIVRGEGPILLLRQGVQAGRS